MVRQDSKRSCWTSPKGNHNRWSLMAVVANQAIAFDKSMLTACPHFVSRMHRGRQTAVLATQGITLADNTGSSENHNFSVSDSSGGGESYVRSIADSSGGAESHASSVA